MNIRFFIILLVIIFLTIFSMNRELSLVEPAVGSGFISDEDVLIKKKFLDNDTYLIVCKGFPKEGETGMVREATMMKSALLNAYYYAKMVFNDSVAPDLDGDVEKYIIKRKYAIIYYVIKKKGLKNRIKK